MKATPRYKLWIKLFWLFVKVNLLSTSGPASVGLLYKESVGTLLTEAQFIETVGFSNLLPGSDSLQIAMFIGHAVAGLPGALSALLGSFLPPTVMMLAVVSLLQRFKGEEWLQSFVQGMSPAIAMVVVVVAYKLFSGERKISKPVVLIMILSFLALLFGVPAVFVLIGAGILGVIWIR